MIYFVLAFLFAFGVLCRRQVEGRFLWLTWVIPFVLCAVLRVVPEYDEGSASLILCLLAFAVGALLEGIILRIVHRNDGKKDDFPR